MTAIAHGEDSDVWSWRNQGGDLLVKLRIRPVRDGTLTAVTGIVALKGRADPMRALTLTGP